MTTDGNPNHRTVEQIAEDAIDLFLEYRIVHGYRQPQAKAQAIRDVVEGTAVDIAKLHAEMEEEINTPSLRSGAMSAE